MKNLLDKIGILDISHDCIISYNYDYVVGYALDSKSLFLQSEASQHEYYSALTQFLNTLDTDISEIQFLIQQSIHDKHVLDFYTHITHTHTVKKTLIDDAYSHFNSLSNKTRTTYIFFTIATSSSQKMSFTQVASPTACESLETITAIIDKLNQKLSGVQKKINTTFTRLTNDDLFKLCHSILNPDQDATPLRRPPHPYQEAYSVREQWVNRPWVHEATHLTINDHHLSTLAMSLLPTRGDIHVLHHLLHTLRHPFTASLRMTRVDKKHAVKKMYLTKQFEAYPLFRIEGPSNEIDSLEKQSNIEEKEAAIEALAGGFHHIYELSFYISFIDTNASSLKRICKEMINHYYENAHYLTLMPCDYNQLHSYLSHLPSQSQFCTLRHWLLSEQLSYLLPFHDVFKGTKTQQMVFKTKDDILVPFSLDHNGLPASHGLVIGSTGSGKSFFMNWLIKNMIIQTQINYHITIIDMGGSYEKLCRLFDGVYIKVEILPQYAIQLFPKKSYIFENGAINYDFIVFITQMIFLMIGDDRSFSPYEEQLVQKYILLFYERYDDPVLLEFRQFLEALTPTENEEKEFIKMAVNNLKLFTEPNTPYSCLFNSKTSIDYDNPFIVFDITKLKSHKRLQAIYIHLISNSCKLKMFQSEKKNIKQLLIRDEVWSILKDDSHRTIVEEEYRTARKYGTHTLSVSNSVQDFVGNACVDAIRQNSQLIYVLPIKYEDAIILEQYGFNTNEIKACQDLQQVSKTYSQIFVKMGDLNSFVIHLAPSKLDYQICSKDFESNQLYNALEQMSSKQLFQSLLENSK